MIKQRKCVYDDVIYVSRTSQSTCAAQLIMLIETETVFLSYRLSITTEKFGYSLSRKTYWDRNTRWNTRNMTASTIDGLKKDKKAKKTDKQTWAKSTPEGKCKKCKATYSRYQSTYTAPFAADEIKSRIILEVLGTRIRRKPKFDNTTKPAKRNELKFGKTNTGDMKNSSFE